jgi:hypothetical protein
MEKVNMTGTYILPNVPRVDSCLWEVGPLPSMPVVHWLSRFVFHLATKEVYIFNSLALAHLSNWSRLRLMTGPEKRGLPKKKPLRWCRAT